MRPRHLLSLAIAAALLLGASAGPSFAQAHDPADPWEHLNRKFFAVQQGLDRHIFGPLSRGYGGLVPRFVRKGVANFARNLTEPLVMVNDLLQGHPGRAASTLGRFAINSTVGVGGLIDVAAKGRIPHHDNGFGLTLGRWGLKPGPYMFLPLLGPSTLRDSIGDGADIGLNPLNYLHYRYETEIGAALVVVQGLDTRLDAAQDLETIEQTSTDPYATLRSYYLQNRAAEVADRPADIPALPDFDDPGAPPAAATTGPTPQPAAALNSAPAPAQNSTAPGAPEPPATPEAAPPEPAPGPSAAEATTPQPGASGPDAVAPQ